MERPVTRRGFSASVLGVCAASFISPGIAKASGAASGSWCLPLTKAARNELFDFSLEVLDPKGTRVFTLSEYVGRPVWVQFFASWCGPCNHEAADVVRIAAKYGDAIHTVGIDVEETAEKARSFRDAHKIPFPIALDPTGGILKTFGGGGIPTHVFFDVQGGISCVSLGDLTAEQMDNEIAVALAKVIPTAATPSSARSTLTTPEAAPHR